MDTKALLLERIQEQLYINEIIREALNQAFPINEDFTGKEVGDNEIVWDVKTKESIKDKAEKYFNTLKDKYNAATPEVKSKIKKAALIAFLGTIGLSGGLEPDLKADTRDVNHAEVKSDIVNIADDVLDDDNQAPVKITNPYEKKDNVKAKLDTKSKFVRPRNTEMSPEILKHLKEYEGFRRKAYDLGDGAKTIGYGHAIFKDASKSNNKKKYSFLPNYENVIVGKTSITDEQAEQLLIDDYNEARTQLDAIFNKWEAQGIPFYITQEMYDSMISLIFNRGIGAFRNSDFIQLIKKGPEYYAKAADTIKDMSSHNFKKFPGLKKRRKSEANMFIKGYKELKNKVFKKLGL